VEDTERRKNLNTIEVLKQLITEEGVPTLYRGIVPVLESLCISNFVYFYTFHSLKALRGGSAGQSVLSDLLLGSLAGAVNVVTTTPFWVVNTRLKMKGINANDTQLPYDRLIEGLMYVYKTEGVAGLWAGTVPSLILVSNPAIQFMVYEAIKRRVVGEHGSNVPSMVFFLIGAMAKTVATCLTYPLQLVQTKLRHGSADKLGPNDVNIGTIRMLVQIVNRQGAKGLYRGLEAKLLQTVLTAALMFMVYEKIAKTVTTLLRSGK
jgi:solute carrier family 25 (peroxisomal adenine nucleotide transporter), member 17